MSRKPRAYFRKPNVGSNRMFSRSLRPVGQAILGHEIEPLVHDICRRITGIYRRTRGGTYLLADSEGRVYLLAEEASTTDNTVRREIALLVGLYTMHGALLSEEDLRDALIEHFNEIGFVVEEAENA